MALPPENVLIGWSAASSGASLTRAHLSAEAVRLGRLLRVAVVVAERVGDDVLCPAVLDPVDLDHQAFLGNDRESIGFEKAGIFRKGQPALVGAEGTSEGLPAREERAPARSTAIVSAGSDSPSAIRRGRLPARRDSAP